MSEPPESTKGRSRGDSPPRGADDACPRPGSALYWAFISYSHDDTAVAARLQRDLEGYRVPRRLVGRETAVGKVPLRLRPVYRDRDELRAGADLGTPIRQALAESRWLIVVCSPAAARSVWVQQEIVHFKRLHGADGDRRVLAVIARGEPFASAKPGHEAEECLPLPLRFALDERGEPHGAALEPAAADLREHGDGRHRATLKLLAGMLDVPLDELVRRDLRRRLQWASAIALGSSIGMVVLGALAVAAVQARDEARVQRAEAEGLIEFMLGDLRKKLEPVGRLDVLDAVGVKALAHYDAQQPDRLDASALGRRARAQHLIGEMRERRGQLDAALEAFTGAAATTTALLGRAPLDAQRIFDHAQSVYWVGYAAWRRGQVAPAEQAFQHYRELAQRLLAIDPSRADWQIESAYAADNLGVVLVETGRAQAALKEFEVAREVYRRLLPSQPELRFDLAHTLGWMAVAHEQLGAYAQAIEVQRAKRALFEQMDDAARNSKARHGIMNAHVKLGRLELLRGRLPEAEAQVLLAMAIGAELVEHDPSNLFWLDELTRTRLVHAQVLLGIRRAHAARALVETLQSDVQRLLDSDADSPGRQVLLQGEWLALRARLAIGQERVRVAEELSAYLHTLLRFDAQLVQRPVLAVSASTAQFELGRLLAAAGDHPAAQGHWRAALVRLEPHRDTIGLAGVALEAVLYQAVEQPAQARARLDRLQDSPYRHPDLAELRHHLALAAGAAPDRSLKRSTP